MQGQLISLPVATSPDPIPPFEIKTPPATLRGEMKYIQTAANISLDPCIHKSGLRINIQLHTGEDANSYAFYESFTGYCLALYPKSAQHTLQDHINAVCEADWPEDLQRQLKRVLNQLDTEEAHKALELLGWYNV